MSRSITYENKMDSKLRDWPILIVFFLCPLVLSDTRGATHIFDNKILDFITFIIMGIHFFSLSYFYSKQSLSTGRRILFLGIAVFLGFIWFFDSENLIKDTFDDMEYLILVFPTFYTLWIFRTYDVQRQIDKTQESANNSSFLEAVRMLMADESLSKKIALEQLIHLKESTSLNEARIDAATRHISLEKKDLHYIQLNNINLSFARLVKTNFTGASLKGANLRFALLKKANLQYADLENANLEYADLSKADLRNARLEGAELTKANLKEAIYNDGTKFPNDFDPVKAGAQYKQGRCY